MTEKKNKSQTALVSAFVRAYHAAHGTPKVFDDFLAERWFSPEEKASFAKNLGDALSFYDPESQGAQGAKDPATALARMMATQGAPISRARYTEDRLEQAVEEGVVQYVILGAGLDTYAFRKPLGKLKVFEVDLPDTQEMKRERLASFGEAPSGLHFVGMDFQRETLSQAFEKVPFDSRARTFFSWLGVTYYLPRETVFETLRSMATFVPAGSEIVFDYLDADAFDPRKASPRSLRLQAMTRALGEPMITGFSPDDLAELAPLGLRLEESLSPADIEKRYFQGRTDGLCPLEHLHFARAVVS